MLNQLLKPILEALPENNRWERIWVLAKTDFLKRYYGSFLGLLWALINPLFQIAVYYFVFRVVFNSKQENFALFLFLGLILEMFFGETTTTGLNIIRGKRHVLENIKINWYDVYYAATLSTFFALLFNFSIYFIAGIFMEAKMSLEAVYVIPLLVFNLVVFSFAVQVILSTIQIYLRDIVHLWDMSKMMILWLSGIFYPIDPTPGSDTEILAYLTPLSGIAYNARQVLLYGEPVHWGIAGYDLVYTLILLLVALFVFKKYVRKALEKI